MDQVKIGSFIKDSIKSYHDKVSVGNIQYIHRTADPGRNHYLYYADQGSCNNNFSNGHYACLRMVRLGVWTNAESESAKSNSEAREKLSEGQEVLKPSIISL